MESIYLLSLNKYLYRNRIYSDPLFHRAQLDIMKLSKLEQRTFNYWYGKES